MGSEASQELDEEEELDQEEELEEEEPDIDL